MKDYELRFPFSTFLEKAFDMPFSREFGMMKTDIHQKDGTVYVEIEVPGFTKEEIDVKVKDGYLQIRAEHQEEKEEKEYSRKERYYGKLERSYYIGRSVAPGDVKASLKSGVLTLSYPENKETEGTDILID